MRKLLKNQQSSSLSSPLLLRNPPHTVAIIPIQPMILSSQSSSIFNTSRHIMPNSAQVYKGMIYSKTDLPWQMNNTLIIKIFPPKLPRYAKKCEVLSGFPNILFLQV